MQPSTYSIVWIIWCTITSPNSNVSPWPPWPPWGASSSSMWLCWRLWRISCWRLSSSGLGSSSMGTEMKAMRMRNACSPPCPGMIWFATGTLPISMNILMSESSSDGGDCFHSEHPSIPAWQAAGLKSLESMMVLSTNPLPSTIRRSFHLKTAQPVVAAPGLMHHMLAGIPDSSPPYPGTAARFSMKGGVQQGRLDSSSLQYRCGIDSTSALLRMKVASQLVVHLMRMRTTR
mmetsp:Transcript_30873/g.64706  ORF Transcript_30873/g.64706 Transcript_30873/m.64706 type:complete len:232 (-) Transcript_30873:1953-2648(-)